VVAVWLVVLDASSLTAGLSPSTRSLSLSLGSFGHWCIDSEWDWAAVSLANVDDHAWELELTPQHCLSFLFVGTSELPPSQPLW
jgi:hypothetical protein